MKFLIFSDLHNFDADNLKKIDNLEYDAIVFLGDVDARDLSRISCMYQTKPIYGILGNHDTTDIIDKANTLISIFFGFVFRNTKCHFIENFNLEKVDFNGISFFGIEGCVKYKEKQVGFTQEEANKFNIPKVDILFSHDTGYQYMGRTNKAHEGFRVIDKYLKEQKPKYHIFGHYHENKEFNMYDTKCFCVVGCNLFDTETGIMKNIFQ